jgi:hypothetical protein
VVVVVVLLLMLLQAPGWLEFRLETQGREVAVVVVGQAGRVEQVRKKKQNGCLLDKGDLQGQLLHLLVLLLHLLVLLVLVVVRGAGNQAVSEPLLEGHCHTAPPAAAAAAPNACAVGTADTKTYTDLGVHTNACTTLLAAAERAAAEGAAAADQSDVVAQVHQDPLHQEQEVQAEAAAPADDTHTRGGAAGGLHTTSVTTAHRTSGAV